jgi:hypothetical protein
MASQTSWTTTHGLSAVPPRRFPDKGVGDTDTLRSSPG